MTPQPRHIVMLLSNGHSPDSRVQKEARSLTQAGCKVTIICWDRLGQLPNEEESEGAKVIRISVKSSYSRGTKQVLWLPLFWIAAMQKLISLKPDIVHCHDLDTVPPGYAYAAPRQIPWIFDAHECYPEQMKGQVSKVIYCFLLVLEKFTARSANLTITVGELLAQRFRQMGATVVVVGNYQDLSRSGDELITRQQLGYGDDDYLVAYIGGFTRQRAVLALILAVDLYPDVKILLAGDGPLMADIYRLCVTRPHVRYVGWIPLRSVPDYASLSDVIYYGLLPGDRNNEFSTPNALFHAMAAGKPLLTTRLGEVAHIVEQEKCGLVIDNAEPLSIADGLKLLRDPVLRVELGRNGRKAAEENYNWLSAESNLLEAYRAISKS